MEGKKGLYYRIMLHQALQKFVSLIQGHKTLIQYFCNPN